MEVTYPAGFRNRFLTSVLDFIIIFLITGIISYFLYGVFYHGDNSYPTDILGLFYTVLLAKSMLTPMVIAVATLLLD
ncbi:hypothetical protein [Halobacillus halophilus]|uniref:hypothetical protein n=1 Tax=Halobacillus halophilus TaxID=1570 RepID=UPI0002D5BF05|nr:hypothetical protein [Halobacillus halophilus]